VWAFVVAAAAACGTKFASAPKPDPLPARAATDDRTLWLRDHTIAVRTIAGS